MPRKRSVYIALLGGILSFFYPQPVDAQNSFKSSVGFGVGYAYQALKSELFSPLVHTGPSFAMQIYYRTEGLHKRLHLQLTYDSYSLTSSVEGLTTEGDQGLIQAGYHRLVSSPAARTRIYLGGVFDVHLCYRTNTPQFGNNQTGEIISSISPSVLVERGLGRSRLSAQAWIAVLSFVLQPGYAQSYPETYLTSFGNLFRAQARLSYVWPMGKRFQGRLDWQFIYFNLDKYEYIRSLNMEGVFSVAYKFRKQ